MFKRPRRGALGLRGRIVGLVLFTTVATLAVAALTLLGPLESKLRNSALQTLRHELQHPTVPFRRLNLTTLQTHSARSALNQQQQQLSKRVGGIVIVLGWPDSSWRGTPLSPHSGLAGDPYDDTTTAF